MLRAVFLWLSEQPRIFRFVRKNRLARKLASRFVAGETIDEAMWTVRDLNASNLSASLDLLGESVLHAEEAQRACHIYLDLLERIHSAKANANVSVKLTQMGLDIDEQLCVSNMRAIIGKAKQYDSFVRIDMEQSSYTPCARACDCARERTRSPRTLLFPRRATSTPTTSPAWSGCSNEETTRASRRTM